MLLPCAQLKTNPTNTLSLPSAAAMAPSTQSVVQSPANALGKAAASAEVLEAMQAYADGHQVNEMLRLLLTRLLEEQPLDPIEFLVHAVRDSEPLDALEKRCAAQRFDLRRERTKRKLAASVFKRLLALQARKDGKVDMDTLGGQHLARGFLMEQLCAGETRGQLRELFPRHYRDLAQWFRANEKQLPQRIDADKFAAMCLQVLATKASAS